MASLWKVKESKSEWGREAQTLELSWKTLDGRNPHATFITLACPRITETYTASAIATATRGH